MKIYVSHLKKSNFKQELYEPLRNSGIDEFIFPHENSDEPFKTRELFENKGCNLVLAEVSNPSTGQGIELGWASILNIPIICIYKTGSKIANSLKVITKDFIEYSDSKDLINKLNLIIEQGR